jgi:hypothetical protein
MMTAASPMAAAIGMPASAATAANQSVRGGGGQKANFAVRLASAILLENTQR